MAEAPGEVCAVPGAPWVTAGGARPAFLELARDSAVGTDCGSVSVATGDDGARLVDVGKVTKLVLSGTVAWELDWRDSSGLVVLGLEVLAASEIEEVLRPMLANAVFTPEICEGPGLAIGWVTFVDR